MAGNRNADFNQHQETGKPSCSVGLPDYGGATCADLYQKGESARFWGKVGFAAAGTLAVTALVLKLTEGNQPETPSKPTNDTRFACAPGLGLNASCRLTF
jgi:hypothetical protein